MTEFEEYPKYRDLLEDNRDILVKSIDVKQFFVKLRTESVFNLEDEQSITQNVRLSTNTEKAGAFLDKLATKGQMGFKIFLGMLETRYPELYKQLSGKDPVLPAHSIDIPPMETCQQHREFIQKLASDSAEMANKVDSLRKSKEQLLRKVNELQRLNDILKSKHIKNMIKLQRFDALQQTLKMRQHELNDLTTQQRNILATSLQLQQEKEAIQRKLRSSNVEITNLKRQLEHAKEHERRKSTIFERRAAIPRVASLDSARSKAMEMEIDKLRSELSAVRGSKDVDVEVAILQDDLRDKTAECERLAEEWQRTQKELNNAEEERIQSISDVEDARYAFQNYEREAARYKQLYELNIKHSDRTEEDLKKARDDRNSLETHVDSLLREQRDLLCRLQDMQNKNMNLSHENSVLDKAVRNGTPRRRKGGYPDLGYAGGSQSESSKDGSRPNSMEECNKDLSPEQATIPKTTSQETTATKPKEGRLGLHLNIRREDSIDSDEGWFRDRAGAIGTRSPIARSPLRFRDSGNIYASLHRTPENEVDKADSMPNSSCGSIGSNNDKGDSFDLDSDGPNRPLARQRRLDNNMSMDVQAGSKRNRYTLTCFGGPSLAIDDSKIVHKEVNEDDYDDDDDDDAYDYPESFNRRSMSLTDINVFCNDFDYDFVEVQKPKK